HRVPRLRYPSQVMPQTSPPLSLRLNPADNVVIAQCALLPGTTLAAESVTVKTPVPAGHKVATHPIKQDEAVRRYGQVIGFATVDIAPGEHVHTHNCEMRHFQRDYAFATLATPTERFDPPATFQGIV